MMPRYNLDIGERIYEEEARKMLDYALSLRKRYIPTLLCSLWITGARSSELAQIKKEDISVSEDEVQIRIVTMKRRKGKYTPKKRTLRIKRPKGINADIFLEKLILRYEQMLPLESLIPRSTSWMLKKMRMLAINSLGKEYSPYHWRHSVCSWMLENGYTLAEIAEFRGTSIAATIRYLHSKPFLIDPSKQNRSRNPYKRDKHGNNNLEHNQSTGY